MHGVAQSRTQLKLLIVLISEGDKTYYIAHGEGVPGEQIVNWPFLSTKDVGIKTLRFITISTKHSRHSAVGLQKHSRP